MPFTFSKMRRVMSVILAIGVLAVSGLKAQTPSLTYTDDDTEKRHAIASEAYYKQFSVNWTDADGIDHVSNLTDVATDPAHIVALLTEVYLNPQIPGYIFDEASLLINDGRADYANVPYKPCTAAPYNMDPDLKVEKPVSGATALLVEMKNTYHAPTLDPQQGLESIKSVRVIPRQIYVSSYQGATNPGYLFNIEASINKFFIITKGSIRPVANAVAMFYDMYEEFSPSNQKPIYDAYARMNAGEQFPVDHNCSSVIGQQHDIVMSPQGDNKDYSINLLFYLPDLRFNGETRANPSVGEIKYEYYSYYSEHNRPFFFFNKIEAKIDGEVTSDYQTEKALVPVSWVSSYKDVAKSNSPEIFYIYRVVNDVVEHTPIPKSEIVVTQPETILNEDGSLVRAASTTVSVKVREPLYPNGYNVRYLVTGRRYGSEFSFVESNIVEAPIPGMSQFEFLDITIDGQAISSYDVAAEKNSYIHNIHLTDSPAASGKRLLNGHITVAKDGKPGSRFELRRYENGTSNFAVVATMEVTGQEPDKTWANGTQGVHVYNATITYPEGVNTSGLELSVRFKSEMDIPNPANDKYAPILAVDGRDGVLAKFADRFDVSTRKGDHPGNYTYLIAYIPAETTDSEFNNNEAVSNSVNIAIPTRQLTVGYVPYTLEEIVADTDADNRLPLNPIGVAVVAAKNPAITGFTITDITKGEVVARIDRTPTGSFEIHAINADGSANDKLNATTQPAFSGKLPVRLSYPVDVNDEFALTIVYANGNTYGNIRSQLTPLPAPEIVTDNLAVKENVENSFTYTAKLDWTANGLSVKPWPAFDNEMAYSTLGYNVWAKQGDNSYELRHSLDTAGLLSEKSDESDPSDSSDLSDLSDLSDSSDVSDAAASDSSDPAAGDANSRTLYYDFSAHKATHENPVETSHIVRLYAKAPAELLMAPADLKDGYVIAETSSNNSIAESGPTLGIEDIESARPVTYRWYDLRGIEINPDRILTDGIYIRVSSDGNSEKVTLRRALR